MARTRKDRQDLITGDLDRAHGGPPRLRLGLLGKLKILIIANIIPLGLAAWLGWKWHQGEIEFDRQALDRKAMWALAALVVCCGVIAVSSWIVMPVVRWVRDYPAWHYRNRSAALWALPTGLGYLLWVAVWLLLCLCAVAVVALVITALWVLAEQVGVVGAGTAGDATSGD